MDEEKYDKEVSELVAKLILHLIRKADKMKYNRVKFCKDVTHTLVGFVLYLNIDDTLAVPDAGDKGLN